MSESIGGFAAASAVRRSAPGSWWDAVVEPDWDILGNTNGGYLLSICARALQGELERRDPVTVTAHYLAPGRAGAVRVETETIRSGRRFGTGRATLMSDRGPVITVLATFADEAHDGAEPLLQTGGPPDMANIEDCLAVSASEGFPPPFMSKVNLSINPADAGFLVGEPSGRALLRGWFSLPGDEPIDTIGLLLAADAFPPTIFNARLPVGWAPTLELTVHVRARPALGPLRCKVETRFVASGFLEVDGEIWDSQDRLVVQSRQLALVPRG